MTTGSTPAILSPRELAARLSDPDAAEACSVAAAGSAGCLVVDLDAGTLTTGGLIQPACVVIGLTRVRGANIPTVVDAVADTPDALERLLRAVAANPIAASVLAQVVRHNARADVQEGLLAESLAYSTLQHGTEFEAWLAQRGPPRPAPAADLEPVRLERAGDLLWVTLDRPHRRNAYSAAMRDALCNALTLPLHDPGIRHVRLRGMGPAFCAGGDLDEFGAARDAALAHATRMTRSAALLLHRLRDRVVCDLHGACIGAGIELPAFTAHVRARRDAFFQLPEVAMGLVPGAGGTVSVTKRIGRQRATALAITGERVDAETALRWGLVDELVERLD